MTSAEKSRRYREKHPDRCLEKGRKWYREKYAAYSVKNRKKLNEQSKKWALEHPEKKKAAALRYRNAHKEEVNERRRQLRYGLRPGQFMEMLQSQRGLCAICKKTMTTPHVDHCHQTGRVRGLLCHPCNVGIGCFRDSRDLLKNVLEYLN
jgi:hypothetical protein